MAGTGFYLEVDASDLQDEIDRLRSVMTQAQFDRAMYRIFQRTGGHVRQILRSDLPKEYHVRAGDVSSAVRGAKVASGTGTGVGCSIPVVAPRRSIGGGFRASGGAHGWNSLRRKYRVKSRIIKAAQSTLPQNMSSYGGYPPFRNLGSRLGGLTFTRKTRNRFPIVKVEGIAIPQMPINRSEADVQDDIKKYMYNRMEHEFQRLIAGGR